MKAVELTWADRMIQQGALGAKREMVRRQVRTRFGQATPAVEARLDAADSDTLDRMIDQVILAPTLEEFLAGA